jgi:hypothetical protein
VGLDVGLVHDIEANLWVGGGQGRSGTGRRGRHEGGSGHGNLKMDSTVREKKETFALVSCF